MCIWQLEYKALALESINCYPSHRFPPLSFFLLPEQSLTEKKKYMAEVIEQSNLAYEQRDRAQLEIMAIEQAIRKEQESFDQQMNEMQRILDEELQLTSTKAEPDPEITAAEEAARAEAERKAAVAAALAKEKEELAQKRQQRLRTFEEAFRKISSATGVADVDELVHSFIASEEKNFSLYSYVNEQADEVELLEGQVQDLQDEKAQLAQDDGTGSNKKQYEQAIQNMDVKMKATKEQIEKMERQCEEEQRTTDSIKDAIKVTHFSLLCDNAHKKVAHSSASCKCRILTHSHPHSFLHNPLYDSFW